MTETELLAIIRAGEGSKSEFKRDDVNPERISGIRRGNLQEWLMDTVVGRHVTPHVVPDYEEVEAAGGRVAIVSVAMGLAKPYAVQRGDRQDYYLRYGNTCRLATREQMLRLFESGGLPSVERTPVHGSTVDELDMRRLDEYFRRILGDDDVEDWRRTLLRRELLVEPTPAGEPCCSCAAYVLFAIEPRRRLPQAGLRLLVFPGTDMDYDASLDEVLDLPCVGLGEQKPGRFIEPSLPDRTLAYLQPHISRERLTGATRSRRWDYPPEAIRELVVNAFAHRDWTRQNDIRLTVYRDRLEVTSPGALPNGMTVDKMKGGQQTPRNTNLVRILRDYGMMDDRGMGMRRKVIPLLREHNGCEPEFEAADDYFRVRLPHRAG